MLDIIKKLDAGTVRGLIVATIPLLVLIASLFGLDEAVVGTKLNEIGEKVVALVTLGGIAWAAYARFFNPTPPITETAKQKTADMIASGKLDTVATPAKQGGFYTPFFVAVVGVLAALILMIVSGCAVNPHKTAQSLEQQGDATYGELVIAKEQGAKILSDATVSDAVKRPIAQLIVDAKPITDGMQDALILYSQVKAEVSAGTNSQERLATVDRELANWIAQAQPLITQLVKAIAGARK